MFRKLIIPAIALAGVVFAVFTVIRGDAPPPAIPSSFPAPQSPYPDFVAASGLIEAGTENISIGATVAGVIAEIFVAIGAEVKNGDPLFRMDDRAARAEIEVRHAAVKLAEAQLAENRYDLTIVEKLAAKNVSSDDALAKSRFATGRSEAQLALANAELHAAETELDRLTVRASINGTVLQLKAHPGEYAPVANQYPLMLIGGTTPLHVRAEIDENDAWRVRAGASARGCLRGNPAISTPLTFVRFEPYVLPKHSLTGDTTERVDTRVLQVVFSLPPGDLPLFVGQRMDVFIQAPARPGN